MSTKIGAMDHVKSYLRAMSENSISGKIYSFPEKRFDKMEMKIVNLWTNFKSGKNEKDNTISLLNRAGSLTKAAMLSLAWIIVRIVTVPFTVTGIMLGSMENGLLCISKKHRQQFITNYQKIAANPELDSFLRRTSHTTTPIEVLASSAQELGLSIPKSSNSFDNGSFISVSGNVLEDSNTILEFEQTLSSMKKREERSSNPQPNGLVTLPQVDIEILNEELANEGEVSQDQAATDLLDQI